MQTLDRLTDSAASVCFFVVTLVAATLLTAWTLVRDLAVSLRNIWSRP